jgi:glycosyltransferase involved in cell wall biosynthesis
MDPIKRLYENRNNIRKKNLTENIEVWRFILDNIEDLSPEDHTVWLRENDINSTKLGCFIGELKIEKDLPFLIEAVSRIRAQINDFEFIIFCGESGKSQIELIIKEHPWIKFGGYADSKVKAHLSRAGAVILNPGRVGLIAVDSIAMGAPIVTRKLKNTHAPEIEYLEHPRSILIANPDMESFVDQSMLLLGNSEVKEPMKIALRELVSRYSAKEMAQNFHSGVGRNI